MAVTADKIDVRRLAVETLADFERYEDPEAFRLSLAGRRGAVCTVVEATAIAKVGDAVEVLAPVTA